MKFPISRHKKTDLTLRSPIISIVLLVLIVTCPIRCVLSGCHSLNCGDSQSNTGCGCDFVISDPVCSGSSVCSQTAKCHETCLVADEDVRCQTDLLISDILNNECSLDSSEPPKNTCPCSCSCPACICHGALLDSGNETDCCSLQDWAFETFVETVECSMGIPADCRLRSSTDHPVFANRVVDLRAFLGCWLI